MSQRMYSYLSGWEWHILQQTTPENMIKICPEAADWILHLQDNNNNGILITNPDAFTTIVQGMLHIQLSDDKDDVQPFHFWMTPSKLITIHNDNFIPMRLQNINHTAIYEQCKSAPEALCAMINILLEHFHISLDQFQSQLGDLELKVRMYNHKDLLDDIIERRYDLLHYSHLYLPYRELEGILKEAYLDLLEDTKSFVRLEHRFERLDTLLKHYALEIDTLLSVDDAISSMRGNEIIRTLTIFTVLCLPATILGSIWGSNFVWLPFKNDPLGFVYLIVLIFIITSMLSLLLWKKGWTGDIITGAKKKKRRQLKLSDFHLQNDVNGDTNLIEQLPPRRHRGIKQISEQQSSIEQQMSEQLPKRSKRHK